MPITLKKLAEALGLDHSTVAYALSGKGTVKEATRQRVREMAARLGYVPNGLARRMRAKHTGVLGLVVGDLDWAGGELVRHLFRGGVARGYEVQIALSESDAALEDKAVRSLLETRADGIIVRSLHGRWADVPEGGALRQTAGQGVPVVTYGAALEGSPFGAFLLPPGPPAAVLTEHLLALGHRRLAWLLPAPPPAAGPPTDGPPTRGPDADRLEATRRILREHGLGEESMAVVTGEPDPLSPGPAATPPASGNPPGLWTDENLTAAGVARGRRLMRRAMALAPRPSAVLCGDDVTAIGAIHEALSLGLRVPEDVAVAAGSRTPAADLSPLTLTTAAVPADRAAAAVLDLLTGSIARPAGTGGVAQAAGVVTVEPVLVLGQSTGGGGKESTER